ncbi:hypothetical protein ANCCAN_04591 [Ancylostoma caninum]|uniref:VWFA domain-containing protein n=1 Tax=Ancylostoma caninum TaxID=29170 RepID=A0A368H253_ANCCA|nr:hypothetical protein ANCCAN_04591 [Ancylostoma caninum]
MHMFLSCAILAIFITVSEPVPTNNKKQKDVLKDVVPIKDNVNCLVVADLYNFGKNETRYAQERRLIKFVASRFFERTDVSTMGIATYGYVPELPINLNKALDRMAVSYDEFAKNLEPNTQLRSTNEHSNTAQALYEINVFKQLKGRANCLVFISAQQNTKHVPRLFIPWWNRIVVVGFDNTDVTEVIRLTPSVSVQVPYKFRSKNVHEVVDKILEAF